MGEARGGISWQAGVAGANLEEEEDRERGSGERGRTRQVRTMFLSACESGCIAHNYRTGQESLNEVMYLRGW